MHSTTLIVGCIILQFGCAFAADYCYRDEEGCGPGTEAWPPVCHSGQRQSPIDLPSYPYPFGSIKLNLNVYKGAYFNLRNSGHTVAVTFDESVHNQILTFPDPLEIQSQNQTQRQYRFDHAHFHWGPNDKVGSEHTYLGYGSAMELHFVHYLAKYNSVSEALKSGDENALAVIGVMIEISNNRRSTTLRPIAENLNAVENAENEATVEEPLDFTRFIKEGGSTMYTYKGSLTSPNCDEQVNWYVFGDRARASKAEVALFRSMLMDSRGQTLDENYRPVQKLNGRKVYYGFVNR